MTYELALELKNAGFPQNFPEDFIYAGEYPPYIPSLSELIEACDIQNDEVGFALNYDTKHKMWFAHLLMKMGAGSTPEEAVARLWLELNKK